MDLSILSDGTERTKKSKVDLSALGFLLCCESMQEHHIQNLTHHQDSATAFL